MPQHKNTSVYLEGCHKTITQSIWQDATEKSINPTGQAAAQQSINLSNRLQVATQLSNNPPGRSQHKINHSIWQAAKQLSINPPGRPPHKNTPIYLVGHNTTIHQSNRVGCHTTIHQPIWQTATKLSINPAGRPPQNNPSICLTGCHTTINQSSCQEIKKNHAHSL
jgi:hypothetical protein